MLQRIKIVTERNKQAIDNGIQAATVFHTYMNEVFVAHVLQLFVKTVLRYSSLCSIHVTEFNPILSEV